ncbi:hypothetical protein CQ12_37525 [Bradyrhizobium jicamae]|uniref:Uncharacterized protein n=1 Tax=Bradyrhizobium jicamae TaxID=280332 RepID=A0A0R3KFE0_9BRAD|nr:hypothetical protein CQ12_37525 [Bradyrhizobium jicamae]
MAITLLPHPFSTREVAFECEPRAISIAVWIDAQHDPRDVTPVGALLISIKHTHVRDHVLLVVLGEGWSSWRYVPGMWIEWGRFHRLLVTRVRRAAQP